MKNQQAPEKKISNNPEQIDVHSMFYTIQGEGPYSGRPAVFIRLAGCNLQCPGCDTEYTTNRETSTVVEIINRVHKLIPEDLIKNTFPPLVVITGGEPFRQNIKSLVNILLQDNINKYSDPWEMSLPSFPQYAVQVETNGTLAPPEGMSPYCDIVCSPKSGKVNKQLLPKITAYKYVIHHKSVSPADGLPIKALDHNNSGQVARPHAGFFGQIYVQPEDVGPGIKDLAGCLDNEKNIEACRESCMKFGYTLQLQIHKIIGVE